MSLCSVHLYCPLPRCGAPIEQKGQFEVEEEGVRHSVTPLWCAAVSGRLAVVRVLLRSVCREEREIRRH